MAVGTSQSRVTIAGKTIYIGTGKSTASIGSVSVPYRTSGGRQMSGGGGSFGGSFSTSSGQSTQQSLSRQRALDAELAIKRQNVESEVKAIEVQKTNLEKTETEIKNEKKELSDMESKINSVANSMVQRGTPYHTRLIIDYNKKADALSQKIGIYNLSARDIMDKVILVKLNVKEVGIDPARVSFVKQKFSEMAPVKKEEIPMKVGFGKTRPLDKPLGGITTRTSALTQGIFYDKVIPGFTGVPDVKVSIVPEKAGFEFKKTSPVPEFEMRKIVGKPYQYEMVKKEPTYGFEKTKAVKEYARMQALLMPTLALYGVVGAGIFAGGGVVGLAGIGKIAASTLFGYGLAEVSPIVTEPLSEKYGKKETFKSEGVFPTFDVHSTLGKDYKYLSSFGDKPQIQVPLREFRKLTKEEAKSSAMAIKPYVFMAGSALAHAGLSTVETKFFRGVIEVQTKKNIIITQTGKKFDVDVVGTQWLETTGKGLKASLAKRLYPIGEKISFEYNVAKGLFSRIKRPPELTKPFELKTMELSVKASTHFPTTQLQTIQTFTPTTGEVFGGTIITPKFTKTQFYTPTTMIPLTTGEFIQAGKVLPLLKGQQVIGDIFVGGKKTESFYQIGYPKETTIRAYYTEKLLPPEIIKPEPGSVLWNIQGTKVVPQLARYWQVPEQVVEGYLSETALVGKKIRGYGGGIMGEFDPYAKPSFPTGVSKKGLDFLSIERPQVAIDIREVGGVGSEEYYNTLAHESAHAVERLRGEIIQRNVAYEEQITEEAANRFASFADFSKNIRKLSEETVLKRLSVEYTADLKGMFKSGKEYFGTISQKIRGDFPISKEIEFSGAGTLSGEYFFPKGFIAKEVLKPSSVLFTIKKPVKSPTFGKIAKNVAKGTSISKVSSGSGTLLEMQIKKEGFDLGESLKTIMGTVEKGAVPKLSTKLVSSTKAFFITVPSQKEAMASTKLNLGTDTAFKTALKTFDKEISFTPAKQLSAQKMIQSFQRQGVFLGEKEVVRFQTETLSKQRLMVGEKLITGQEFDVGQKLVVAQEEILGQTFKIIPQTTTMTQTKTQQKLITMETVSPIPPIEPPPPILVPILFPSSKFSPKKEAERFEKAFEVFGRRYGKVFKLTEKALTKKQALSYGAAWAMKGAGVSFKLKPTEKLVRSTKGDNVWAMAKKQFGVGKGGFFVEKTKYRIDMPGEKQEITYKGLQKLLAFPELRKKKSKRKKRFKLLF